MDIRRIDDLTDVRFREKVLKQHGAFLVDGVPCEVEITDERTAVVRCENEECLDALIGEFRFFAEHIVEFYSENGELLRRFGPVELFEIGLDEIQPSQFYVNRAKLAAVESFVRGGRDVIVPLIADGDRYISLDGHTRLYLAAQMGIRKVLGFIAKADWDVWDFVREAQQRGVFRPQDLELLAPEEYEEKWNGFCRAYFAAKRKDG